MKGFWIIHRHWVVFLLISCLLSACFSSGEWAKKDLDFMHGEILRNHPGIGNPQDLLFGDQLEASYVQAKKELDSAWTDGDRWKALQGFAHSFEDAHVVLEDINPKKSAAAPSPTFKFEAGHQFYWLSIPGFVISKQAMPSYQNMLASINKYMLDTDGTVVFDLRGNTGGNSFYAQEILEHVWGKDYVQEKINAYRQNMYADWRATDGNQKAIMAQYEAIKKQNPPNPELLTWSKKIVDGMNQAVREGNQYYSEHEDLVPSKKFASEAKNKRMNAIVLMDRHCASSCLDFIDMLLASSPHSVLKLGEKTSSDRLYIDIRPVILPSGLGTFWFPMKVYRNRPRLDRQAYEPDLFLKNTHLVKPNRQWLDQVLKDGQKLMDKKQDDDKKTSKDKPKKQPSKS
jgi:hypothetical protein